MNTEKVSDDMLFNVAGDFMTFTEAKELIDSVLSDDLLSRQYQNLKKTIVPSSSMTRSWGHCYVVSEVIYHFNKDRLDLQPYYIKLRATVTELLSDTTHWFLRIEGSKSAIPPYNSMEIIDFTADQFNFNVSYDSGHRNNFLTKEPSKRALELMQRLIDLKVEKETDFIVY